MMKLFKVCLFVFSFKAKIPSNIIVQILFFVLRKTSQLNKALGDFTDLKETFEECQNELADAKDRVADLESYQDVIFIVIHFFSFLSHCFFEVRLE